MIDISVTIKRKRNNTERSYAAYDVNNVGIWCKTRTASQNVEFNETF